MMIQSVKGGSIVKENNFSGWKIPDFSFFSRNSKENINGLPEFSIEHFVIKDRDSYYLLNKKLSEDGRQAVLSEMIYSFRRERINSFDIISSKSENKVRIYRIFSTFESDAISYYRNQMDLKKNGIGFEDGIESGRFALYYILDYDNDDIFETRIWGDTRENGESEKVLNLILQDYLENRVLKHGPCVDRLLKLKKTWLNFVENPMPDTLKKFYWLFPEKNIEPWLKKLRDINSLESQVDIIVRSKNLFKSLKEWKEQSLFCEGEATLEEKLFLSHVSENLHLIFKEFIYGNPYALPITFKLYPVLRGHQSLELDRMLVDFCLIKPEKFLRDLKNHKLLITVAQALDRTFGYEMIGFLQNAKREIQILLNAIKGVKDKELFEIKQECIEFLEKRKKELIN
jgi:hypothetical protein